MLAVIVAAIQTSVLAPAPVPRAPIPLPPFTKQVEEAARPIATRVAAAFERCHEAMAFSNKYGVEAFGTKRFSTEWNRAADALAEGLNLCRDKEKALGEQTAFLKAISTQGSRHDAQLALERLKGVTSALNATREHLEQDALRYSKLRREGWGDPHCVEHPDGYMKASRLCR